MRILIILMFTLLTSSLAAQSTRTPEAQTQYYEFHINYWFNMHHLLWTEAFLQTELDSSMVDVEFTAEEQEQMDVAVQYYRENLVQYDLRAGKEMGRFREWIIQQANTISDVPSAFRPQMKVLFGFDAVYRRHFWSLHKNACELVLEQNLPLIKATEEAYVEGISKLTRQGWQAEHIPVDITYLGKITKRNLRNRPYTTVFPTHVVMNTVGDESTEGGWLELLYHESAHHLILRTSYFISGTIADVAEINELMVPRQLWHAYLFYFTGSLTQQLLTEQGIDYPSTYMERNGVFARYQTVLQTHLDDYLERKVSLADATLPILQALQK